MAFTPQAVKPPKIERVSIKDWMKGTVTAFDDGRTPVGGLRDTGNMIIEQNGTVRPRPSLVQYGPQPTGTILGEIGEFRVTTAGVTTNWLITLQNVAGVTQVYTARGEDLTWTARTGKTFDNSAPARFVQLDNKVLIMNGVDNLSYFKTSTNTVIPFTALSTPSAPALDTNTGLSGSSFKVYYAITANSTVGQTSGSAVLTVNVSTDRDLWNPSTQSIKINWAAVTNAQSYNVYMGVSADGSGQPQMYLIAGGLDSTTLNFTDDGSLAQDVSQPLPTDNSTAGPKVTRGAVINGRVWLVGDVDHPYYVWRGGDYGYELDFSPANGGGFTPVGSGTKELPNSVKGFRNAKGEDMVMVLSQGTNGSGKRSYLSPTTLTYGSSTFIVWQVTESGQDGTDSPDGVIIYQNAAWYPSRDGFKTTGTKPQLQNVLSTDRITNTIQDGLANLNTSAMYKSVGLAYEGRLYWALPVSSSSNNQIWVLDLDREGAWMKPWNVAADWMMLYNDNNGRTHFLVLVNNAICEFTYSANTTDNGSAFYTSATSGQNKFSEDGREWGRLIQLIFVLLRPQGGVDFTVSGKSEDGIVSFTANETFATSATRAGWSEPGAGWSRLRGWSEIVTVPTSFNPASEEVIVEVDEDLQWFQYQWGSTQAGVDYSVSDVIAEYVNVGIKDLA